ncbi:NAD(P)/FAD-dependent oxidoreductase [Halostreptopolyspora alba]|uniref:NAD(P)/FAD-dependent oxidoreductase n=1 Tax=Halostreptopolyspora alba TaxID=2487137 RepID=A0A3N0EE95_9ACTN|nr:NAD(P)/FAD-dependent oxidoreductase [Nocardiopsaceae bacterium YIM 96095]
MYDVVIAGGGPAGLNAALQLGRAQRGLLLSDGHVPRNPGHTVHGFLTRDGARPGELRNLGRQEVGAYPGVELTDALLVAAHAEDDGGFAARFSDGRETHARKILLATGVADQLPAIDGLAELWGVGAFNCPYCSAWEIRGRPLAVLGNDEVAAMMAVHLTQWSPKVVFCTNGTAEISPELGMMLQAHEIATVEDPIRRLDHEAGVKVHFDGHDPVSVAGVFLHPEFRQHSDLPQRLGCTLQEDGTVQVDDYGQTGAPGVYAAGDMARKPSMPMPSAHVVNAASNGSMAGVAIDQELATENAKARVQQLM